MPRKDPLSDKIFAKQEEMLKKLDILIAGKKMRDEEWERKKKGWAIMIRALKEHQILSSQDLEQIARLEIF